MNMEAKARACEWSPNTQAPHDQGEYPQTCMACRNYREGMEFVMAALCARCTKEGPAEKFDGRWLHSNAHPCEAAAIREKIKESE